MKPVFAIIAAILASIILLAVLMAAAKNISIVETGKNALLLNGAGDGADWLPTDNLTSQNLRRLIPDGASHYSTALENGITSFSFKPSRFSPDFSLPPVIRSTFSGSFLTIRFADAALAWEYLVSQLESSQRGYIEGRLGRLIEDYFGEGISLTYTILPMFDKPSSIHLGHNSSGSLVFSLEGMMNRSNEAESRIRELHSGFASTIPTIFISERNLEGRFKARDVRSSDNRAVSDSSKINQWVIERTYDGMEPSRVLVTARRGAAFVIANDETALKEIISRSAYINPPSFQPVILTSARLMDGIMEIDKLASAITGSPLAELLPFELTGSKSVVFSIEQAGEILTVRASHIPHAITQ